MPIIIEFIGFAGSGKTFLKEQFIKEFVEESIVPDDIKLSMPDVLYYTIRNPLGVIYTVMFILSTRQKNLLKAISYIKNIVKYRIKLFKSLMLGREYIIVDEGILHRLRMIRSTSKKYDLLYETIKPRYRKERFSHADILVHVDAPLQTIARRRLNMKNRIMNEPAIENEISKIKDEVIMRKQYTQQDIAAARKEHNFHHLMIDNDQTTSVINIISKIKECASNLSAAR